MPGRPQAQRPEAPPPQRGGPGAATYGAMPGFGMGGFPFGVTGPPRGAGGGGVSFSAGFGFFPSLFGLQFVSVFASWGYGGDGVTCVSRVDPRSLVV